MMFSQATELPPVPVKPTPIPIGYERGPTSKELSTWERLLREHRRAGRELDVAALLLQNIYITYSFATSNGVFLAEFPPELEKLYYEVKASHDKSKKAIRAVSDHKFGVQFTNDDVDIIAPSQEAAQEEGFGLIPLIIAGVIVVGAAIAVALWQTQKALEISGQLREIVARTDATLCSDPNSELCKRWESEKVKKGYEKNASLAETITSGVKSVGSKVATGILLLIGLAIFLRSR